MIVLRSDLLTGFKNKLFEIELKTTDNNLVFIFLTNRTYPSMRRNKWSGEDFRPRIQSIIYDALNTTIK